MNSCELTMAVTAFANAIAAKLESPEEIAAVASVFILLGDAMAAISAQQILCQLQQDKEKSR
ncbi:MAG: hypothetical protein PUC41_05385 [Oscillospiraceae bacterium]|nr:hypothetical protein [Oscillospiraceae bacterium]